MRRSGFALAFALTLAAALPALAQEDDAALSSKVDRLERDVNFMQKQVYRGGAADATGGAPVAGGGNMQVQLSQMEAELRQIRGQIEQEQFASQKNAADLKKLSDDMEYRLRALETKAQAPVAPVTTPLITPVPAPGKSAAAAEAAAEEAAIDGGPAKFDPNASGEPNTIKKAVMVPPAGAIATTTDFPDANAHYSYAFKLLNDKKYAEAATSFDAFVRKYPNDPLISNAYYWLGESYYARSDFTRSGESFRKGFEAAPAGQKAPDNLFKLGKSLAQVKRTNEACIVFAQITVKYADTAPKTAKRAQDERAAMQCK